MTPGTRVKTLVAVGAIPAGALGTVIEPYSARCLGDKGYDWLVGLDVYGGNRNVGHVAFAESELEATP